MNTQTLVQETTPSTTQNSSPNDTQNATSTSQIERGSNGHNGHVRTLSRPAAQAVAGALDSLFSPALASPRAFLSHPFEAMRRMQRDMDRLFDALSSEDYAPRPASQNSANFSRWTPRVEAFERDQNLVIRAELPGLTREQIDVKVEDGVLLLKGERKNERKEDENGFFHSEISYGAFGRALPLPETAEIEKIAAQFRDGILEITIPNAAPTKRSHQVNIS